MPLDFNRELGDFFGGRGVAEGGSRPRRFDLQAETIGFGSRIRDCFIPDFARFLGEFGAPLRIQSLGVTLA